MLSGDADYIFWVKDIKGNIWKFYSVYVDKEIEEPKLYFSFICNYDIEPVNEPIVDLDLSPEGSRNEKPKE